MARSDWRDLHFGSASAVERQWVQQVRWVCEVHAGEQRKIVSGLQEPEMLLDGLLIFVDCLERIVRRDFRH